MQKIKLLVVSIVFFLWTFPVYSGEKSLTLATLDWEPYVGQKLKNQGYVAEIIRESFNRVGYEVKIVFYPWARAVKMSQNGKVDGYFPEYFSEDITAHSQFSEPFPGGPVGFFKKSGSPITYKTLKDLQSYEIGVVRGYVNTAEFDAADYLNKQEVYTDTLNIRKLFAGRIDLFLADKFVGLFLLARDLPDQKGQMEFIEPPLEVKDLYLCISKKTTEADKKLNDFNKGLEQIKEDGTLERILKNHEF